MKRSGPLKTRKVLARGKGLRSRRSTGKPTKAEAARIDRLKHGECVCCWLNRQKGRPTAFFGGCDVHHVLSGARRIGHGATSSWPSTTITRARWSTIAGRPSGRRQREPEIPTQHPEEPQGLTTMAKNYDESASELAMRVLLRVQARHRHQPHFLMSELVGELMDDFGVSRATAFRKLRTAVDVLGINYNFDNERAAKKARISVANSGKRTAVDA